MVGICCTTLGAVTSTLLIGWMMFEQSSGGIYFRNFPMLATSGLSGLGSLLFAVGFAIHGHQASKSRQRITELEAIAAAQGEELKRLRAPYTSAS